MQRDEIRSALKEILENEIGEVVPDLPDDAPIIEKFGLDSVDVVSMVMHLERKFHVRISHEELATLTAVGTLLDLVQSKLSALPAEGQQHPPQKAA